MAGVGLRETHIIHATLDSLLRYPRCNELNFNLIVVGPFSVEVEAINFIFSPGAVNNRYLGACHWRN